MPKIELLNIDCMDYMAGLPDKAFDLAIVDPPYGLGDKLTKGGASKGFGSLHKFCSNKWDVAPNKEYFECLMRVSKAQIIWGGNYFNLPPTRGIICWDKLRVNDKNLSHFELAWTSLNCIARIFKYPGQGGFLLPEPKIHPTQKPVKLYDWLLHNYAKPNQRILDTHLGSGSSAIAAHYFGCDFVGCELDVDYFNAAKQRFERETAQTTLFDVGA